MMQYTGNFIVGDPEEMKLSLQKAEERWQREREKEAQRAAAFARSVRKEKDLLKKAES